MTSFVTRTGMCSWLGCLSKKHLRLPLPLHHGGQRTSSYPSLQSSKMSTHRIRYKHVDEVENLEVYEVGGYHPVHIGDCLNKYTIIHKLGHGSYSTTWLARHESRPGYAAVKIGTATSTQKEADILETLAKSLPGQPKPGKTLIPALIDRFEVRGPNGTHPCLVTRPAMCSLADAVEAGDHRPFQTDVARSLAAQLAMAVAYMHSLGYVHGGESLDRISFWDEC
jgi:serine/threonine-protein kinase SRPK3